MRYIGNTSIILEALKGLSCITHKEFSKTEVAAWLLQTEISLEIRKY